MDIYDKIIGLLISEIVFVHDYMQIYFSDGSILNVYNSFEFSPDDVAAFRGKAVKCVREVEAEIIFTFDDDSNLTVYMDSESYSCPEAMSLAMKGQPIVVWN